MVILHLSIFFLLGEASWILLIAIQIIEMFIQGYVKTLVFCHNLYMFMKTFASYIVRILYYCQGQHDNRYVCVAKGLLDNFI